MNSMGNQIELALAQLILLSIHHYNHTLVGCAMRAAKKVHLGCTTTYISTKAMVRMAHPTVVIVIEHYWHLYYLGQQWHS